MKEHIYDIICRVLSGEATASDQQALSEWLEVSEVNRAEYHRLASLWTASGDLLTRAAFDSRRAWKNIAAIADVSAPERSMVKRRLIPLWVRTGMAAALLLAGFFFLYRITDRQSAETRFAATNANEQVILPDGSRVTLRQGSELIYPSRFASGADRKVTLKGEAFFEVSTDPSRPFMVHTDEASVRVLGTSFNVVAENEGAVVTVAAGRVLLSGDRPGDKGMVLTKGEKGSLAAGSYSRDFVSSENYLYWKTGKLHFREQPFNSVIKELGSMSRTKILFESTVPGTHQEQVINISFEGQSVEDMLTDLCLITHSEWSKEQDVYTIRNVY